MNVYIIVVTYNGLRWIDKCLSSTSDSTMPLNVVVVDNGSTDGTQDFIRAHFPKVVFIQNDKNTGFGKANNVGIEYALNHDCDYVYLLNQDAWIKNNTIEILTTIHSKNDEYGILSPMQINSQEDALEYGFANYCTDKKCPGLLSDISLKRAKEIYDVPFVNAAHWLISRKCLSKVGTFAPIFPHYGEDSNYIQRCRYHNYKVGICPGAEAIHDRNVSTTTATKLYPLFLTYACDINRGTIVSILTGFYHLLLGDVIFSVKNRSIKYMHNTLSIGYLKNIIKGISDIPAIIKTRKITRSSK